ncbi:F-box/kelch-repeat protein At5g26960-like [Lolium rigidum]|uniref:F-box/kelch-repeat protein At5g26960-like n=1 Tax=Lolium rigidum TaxID=89674 RepID=UPI001F5DBCBD|nr:F-box/kelch-repeat protein At5g26960-like [Lolium rigidum]
MNAASARLQRSDPDPLRRAPEAAAMAAESCHSRSISWFVKSCIPADPSRHISVPVPMPVPITAPAGAPSTTTFCCPAQPPPPISSLPDDLILECLVRVPRASLPPLPAVCCRFADLLASHAFLQLRRARGLLQPSLLALSVSDHGGAAFAQALLQFRPGQPQQVQVSALPLPPALLHCGGSVFAHARAVALGRDIFLVGRGATLRVDALTGAARACAPTLFPRKKFAAAAVGGRIYVAGGSARTAAVEEYDPAADAWRVVADAPRRRYGCAGAGAGGVLYVAGGVAVSGDGARALEARVCAGSVDALHVASGAWARPRALPGGGCVVGACGVGDHLYVVASHAVELSFWRWHGGAGRGSDLRAGGGWVALEAPPMPRGSVGLGMAVRVAMAGIGLGTVTAVMSAAAVRGHNAAVACPFEGMVLAYDIAGGKWSRAPDLPHGFRRAACAGVEC